MEHDRSQGRMTASGAPSIWPSWSAHNAAMEHGSPLTQIQQQPARTIPVYQPNCRPPAAAGSCPQEQRPQQQQQQQHPPLGGPPRSPPPSAPPPPPPIPTCFKCGCGMTRATGKQRGKDVAFICEHEQHCGGTRKSAVEKFELCVLELKGSNLQDLCLRLPRNGFQKSCLPAFLKRRNLLAPIRPVCDEPQQFEAVFPVSEYSTVLQKISENARPAVEIRRVPPPTLTMAGKLQKLREPSGAAGMEGWCSEAEVEERYARIPARLGQILLDFQVEGVRYALARRGRCLVADEMGTGKTLQALAIMSCYREDWPLLIVVPASLRLVWTENVEQWLPFLRPTDIHVIFGQKTRLYEEHERPLVTICSYAMFRNLEHLMGRWTWNAVIFDESHKLTTTRNNKDPQQTKGCLALGRRAKRVVLLTGTPCLCRPFDLFNQVDMLRQGLLGKDRWEFGRNYCTGVRSTRRGQNCRLVLYDGCAHDAELHALLTSTLMLRRLKSQVLSQLPPLVRTVIRVAASRQAPAAGTQVEAEGEGLWDDVSATQADMIRDEAMLLESEASSGNPSGYHIVGRNKLEGALDWVEERLRVAMLQSEGEERKLVLFAYHLDVLDAVQKKVQDMFSGKKSGKNGAKKGATQAGEDDGEGEEAEPEEVRPPGPKTQPRWSLIRIDGHVPGLERQALVSRFSSDPNCLVALIGITAGGVGLDLSAASSAVFIELPPNASWLRQAEDRLHRRGQRSVVNIYYLVTPPGSLEDAIWQKMDSMLRQNSAVMNSRSAAEDLHVHCVMTGDETADAITATRTGEGGTGGSEAGTALLGKGLPEATALQGMAKEEAKAPAHGCESGVAGEEVSCGPSKGKAGEADEPGDEIVDLTVQSEDMALAALADEVFGAEEGEEGEEDVVVIRDVFFEFSRHTGRIHLHRREDGSEPMQVQVNGSDFLSLVELMAKGDQEGGEARRQAEAAIEAIDPIPTLPPNTRLSHEAKRLLLTAILEYRAISSRTRPKIFDHVMRPPLAPYLKRLPPTATRAAAPSYRRHVPYADWDFNNVPTDPDVPFRKVLVPKPHSTQYRDCYQRLHEETRQPLCVKCHNPCSFTGSPRTLGDLVCSVKCLSYLTCRFKGGYRRAAAERDRGVCELCQMDCRDLVSQLRVISEVYERKALLLRVNRLFEDRPKLLNRLCLNPIEGNAWHADHIVAVSRGGGECSEDNLRTLCVLCHASVTAAQAKERANENRRKKRRIGDPPEVEVEVGIPAGALLSIGEDGSVTGLLYNQHGRDDTNLEQGSHERDHA